MKRITAVILALLMLCSVAGCNSAKKDENVKTPSAETETTQPEASVAKETDEQKIVGTWVVEKNDIYEGPLKELMAKTMEVYYYVGAEYEFTSDGKWFGKDGLLNSTYEIIDDNQISCVLVNTGASETYDYELNGDELIIYANYTGDLANYGHAGAICFKRK